VGRPLSNLEWVRLAVALDVANLARAALRGVHVTEEYVEATDGHRLFRAVNSGLLPSGVWSVDEDGNRAAIDAKYPNTETVWVTRPTTPNFRVDDLAAALAVCKAGSAGNVSLGLGAIGTAGGGFIVGLPCGKEVAYVNAFYLGSALAGATDKDTIQLSLSDLHEPLFIDISNGRQAAIMPIKTPQARDDWRSLKLTGLLNVAATMAVA
jgi:hypothetical protein